MEWGNTGEWRPDPDGDPTRTHRDLTFDFGPGYGLKTIPCVFDGPDPPALFHVPWTEGRMTRFRWDEMDQIYRYVEVVTEIGRVSRN